MEKIPIEEVQDSLTEDSELGPDERLFNKEEKDLLKKFLLLIRPKRNAEIVSFLYGLNGDQEHSYGETAKKFNLSRGYIAVIERQVLFELKESFERKGIEAVNLDAPIRKVEL